MNTNFSQGDISQGINASMIISSPNVVCECGNKVFIEAVILKKVSPLVIGSQTETIYPIPVYQCSKCGKIPAEFLKKGNAKAILGETDDVEEVKTV